MTRRTRLAAALVLCSVLFLTANTLVFSFTYWVWDCTDEPWCQVPWRWAPALVTLKLDASGLPQGSAQANAFEQAVAQWNSIPGTTLSLNVSYQFGLDPNNHVDGIHSVSLVPGNCADWKGTTWLRANEEAPEIVETDIWLNSSCALPSTAPGQETQHTATPTTSVKRLALSLLGFAIGLGHERTQVAAMNNGDMIERLLADDKAGKRFLYGAGGIHRDLSATNAVDDIPEPIAGGNPPHPFNQAYPDNGATFMRYVNPPATDYKVANGDKIDIEYTISNMGNTSEQDFEVSFYFDHAGGGDSHKIDSVTYGLIFAGESITSTALQTEIASVPDGIYDLRIEVDDAGQVPEYDDGNNRLRHPYEQFRIHPLPPENLTAVSGAAATTWEAEVKLNWEKPSTNALRHSQYKIFRKLETDQDYPATPLATPSFEFHADSTVVHLEDYCYVVTSVNTDNLESERSAEVCIEATRAPYPCSIDFSLADKNSIFIEWSCTSEEDPTLVRYSVYRSLVSGGPYTFLDEVRTDSDGDGRIDTKYNDEDVEYTTTYCYVVTATNQYGESDFSNELCDTTEPIFPPTGLSAFSGSAGVFLNWNDNPEPDIAFYNIYRDAGPTGVFGLIASSVPSDYLDAAVVSGTTYSYYVTALDEELTPNESAPSNTVTVIYIDAPPQAPRNLTAQKQIGHVLLDWTDNTEVDLSHYRIYRSQTAGGPYTLIQDDVAASTYNDTGATPGTTYYYVVTALDTAIPANESAVSNEASGQSTSLAAPTGLAATGGIENISLDWDDHPGGAAVQFNVYRSEIQGGPFTLLAMTATSDYFDDSLVAEVTYYYVVTAFDTGNPDDESNESGEAAASAASLGPPTGLTATGGADQVVLDWNDHPSGPMVHYRVYRSDSSGGPYAQLGSSPTSDYVDGTVVTGSTYYYVVTAFDSGNPGNESGYSSEVSVRAISLTPPTGLTATPGISQIVLDWDDHPAGPATHYNVFRSTTPGGPYSFLDIAVASDYVDVSLPIGITNYYVVTAFDSNNPADESAYSAEASARATSLEPPTGLVASRRMDPIQLDWVDHPAGSSVRYNVYYTWFQAPAFGFEATTTESRYTDWGVVPGKLYRYVVTAVDVNNPNDESAYSAEASVLTTSYEQPTGLRVTGRIGSISLEWNGDIQEWNGNPNEWDGRWGWFRILRSDSPGGPYTEVGQTRNTDYRDDEVENGVTYYYTVTAHDRLNPLDESDPSNEVSARPTSLHKLTISWASRRSDHIEIGWEEYNRNIPIGLLHYRIYRSEERFGTYDYLDTIERVGGISAHFYDDYSIVGGTSYYYVVTVFENDNPDNESDFSNIANPDERIYPHEEDIIYEPPPTVSLELSTASVEAGQPFTLTLTGTSSIGLQAMWWYVRHDDGSLGEILGTVDGGPEVRLDSVQDWDTCDFGTLECSYSRVVTITEPGTYAVKANARDVYYGPGYGDRHASSNGGVAVAIIENRPPQMGAMADQSAITGEILGTSVPASDPDGDVLTYSGDGMPAGSTLDSVTGDYQWMPSKFQKPPHHSGIHVVTFTVSDGELNDSGTLQITVANRAPVVDPIGDRETQRAQLVYFLVTASDPDDDEIVEYRAEILPAGALLQPISDYLPGADQYQVVGDLPATTSVLLPVDIPPDTPLDTQLFTWTPTLSQVGSHTISFFAGDGDQEGSETIVITVTGSGQ